LRDTLISCCCHIFSSPGRRPWELLVWRSVRPASTFSFKRLLLKNQ